MGFEFNSFRILCIIQISVDCSAKTSENLSELFYYAQKTVLHPSPPLYSVAEGKLKDKCVLALNRIFNIVDTDQVVYTVEYILEEPPYMYTVYEYLNVCNSVVRMVC